VSGEAVLGDSTSLAGTQPQNLLHIHAYGCSLCTVSVGPRISDSLRSLDAPPFLSSSLVLQIPSTANTSHFTGQNFKVAIKMEQKVEYQTEANTLPPGAAKYTPNPIAQPPVQTYQTFITPIQSLNRDSAVVDCPKCHQKQPTRVEYKIGGMTHLFAAWLGLGTMCLAAWVPYTISGAKDVDQFCGHCGVLLATKHRSGRVEIYPVA